MFYIVMPHETLASPIFTQAELQREDHPFFRLGACAQELLTEVRRAGRTTPTHAAASSTQVPRS